jgi:hypothetical protein
MLKELIIKVDNKEIHLSPKLSVPIHQTNIPIEHCSFRTHEDIFWKVELIDYNPETNCWRMKVIDYFIKDIKNYDRQKSTREVHRIFFEKFDWPKFEYHLSNYQKIKLLDMLYNQNADLLFRENPNKEKGSGLSSDSSILTTAHNHQTESELDTTNFLQNEPMLSIETHNVEFTIYFSEIHFMLGYVTFRKRIKEIGEIIDFKIRNEYILAEFEDIKSWFAKKLKTKKIKVNATIIISDKNVIEVSAYSQQISMIDEELIDSIKYQRTIALTKAQRISEVDKSLFTADEIFGEMSTEDIEGNVFNQNEQDILGFLIGNNKTRNRKQLEYLSGSKQAENSKLRFTLHPNFGFLFFIEGKMNNHFVWELLNSHATYIWSIEKSAQELELQYNRIEASINTIRDSGREQYKRAYRTTHLDNDLVFCVIEHNDITSNFVEGFVKWKYKLNEKIT